MPQGIETRFLVEARRIGEANTLLLCTHVNPDGDGLGDGDEATFGADPLDPDSDGDGLSDGDGVMEHGTDPTSTDTADDGLEDGRDDAEAGTDPLEGAAIGCALLEELTRRGAITLAATHLQAVALAASSSEGMDNGAMEYDLVGEPLIAETIRSVRTA